MVFSFYHFDHLGSVAYLTDASGYWSQTLNYLPYGEDWLDVQHNMDHHLGQYRFNGKEKDYESGFHYYGARYYWSDVLTGWLNVDPMMDKSPNISPYVYCAWNPVKLIDPTGEDTINYTTSHFLSTQQDISDALIINAHGFSTPPGIRNDNVDYDEDLTWGSIILHDALTVAECIWSTDVYQENNRNNMVTPVFLISCQTGETRVPYNHSFADGLDQALDNTLIIAPVGIVCARGNKMWLAPINGENYDCYWRVLYNGQDIGRIENSDVIDIATLLNNTLKQVNKYNDEHPYFNRISLPELKLK